MSTKFRWKPVLLITVAQFFGMCLWFATSAVSTSILEQFNATSAQATWLTMAVQLGFVIGSLSSAFLNIADSISPKKLFCIGVWTGSIAIASIPLFATGIGYCIGASFITGISLAFVYPIGMKLMASWVKQGRGIAFGLLVGALTLGSAFPHLLRSFGTLLAWEQSLYIASGLGVFSGLLIYLWGDVGPFQGKSTPFDLKLLGRLLQNNAYKKTVLGYLGHMWELYAMWTWLPAFLIATIAKNGQQNDVATAELWAFIAIGAGAIGAVGSGWLSDRWGRSKTTIVNMVVSGLCAILICVSFGQPIWLVGMIAIVWGISIIGDSAQFSAIASEVVEPSAVGTALTLQTSLGFLLTLGSIRLMPLLADAWGWQWVFLLLAIGPAIGTVAMRKQ